MSEKSRCFEQTFACNQPLRFLIEKIGSDRFPANTRQSKRSKACQQGKWIKGSVGETWPQLPTPACIRLLNLSLPKLGFGGHFHTEHVTSSGRLVFAVLRDLSDGVSCPSSSSARLFCLWRGLCSMCGKAYVVRTWEPACDTPENVFLEMHVASLCC